MKIYKDLFISFENNIGIGKAPAPKQKDNSADENLKINNTEENKESFSIEN